MHREFVQVCGQSLEVNAKLIKSDQHEYHDDLVLNYKSMVANLTQLMQEKVGYKSSVLCQLFVVKL